MDTIFVSNKVGKSFRGFTYFQFYTTGFGYVLVHMMERENEISKSSKWTFKEVRVPSNLIVDGSIYQNQGDTRR